MSSVLLGLTMLAVAWLVIWTGKDHSRPSKAWWPFAMRESGAPKKAAVGRARSRLPPRAAADALDQRPWRRRSGS
jgi:hypothetical protein